MRRRCKTSATIERLKYLSRTVSPDGSTVFMWTYWGGTWLLVVLFEVSEPLRWRARRPGRRSSVSPLTCWVRFDLLVSTVPIMVNDYPNINRIRKTFVNLLYLVFVMFPSMENVWKYEINTLISDWFTRFLYLFNIRTSSWSLVISIGIS